MHARAQRLARGWIVGLVTTTVAAVSHSLAGGYRPGILSFGMALVFAGLFGTAVIGRRPSLPRLSVAVGVSQLAFHLLFSTLGSGSGTSVSPGGGMADMSAMGGANPTALAASGHDHLADPAMWIAHALAAVLTIVFLRHAELAVWSMLTRVLARATAMIVPVLTAPVVARSTDRPSVRPLVSRVLVASVSRRGPPLLSF
ncbi:hypothetical protein BH10ACT6_BH10ACT6_01690 [soil metagenome]